MARRKAKALTEANDGHATPEHFLRAYEVSISKALAVPLVVHTVSAPATYVQRRTVRVATEISRLSLWLLVVSTLLFAFLGLVVAVAAARITSLDVHQVQVRLSIAGLAAQLFDSEFSGQSARGSTDLFEDSVSKNKEGFIGKRVGVRYYPSAGSDYVVCDSKRNMI